MTSLLPSSSCYTDTSHERSPITTCIVHHLSTLIFLTFFVQEFESYHLVKFNRGPKIIKKKVTSGKEIILRVSGIEY